jgi:predicted HAD superfamily Cof-like phosphohydrolase
MKKELKLVEDFHKKFKAPVASVPTLISKDRSDLRYRLMREEVEEYLSDGVHSGEVDKIAKELADILYAVYGTILEHGLQEKMEKIFDANHCSQMTKDFHKYKMVKGRNFKEAEIGEIIGK